MNNVAQAKILVWSSKQGALLIFLRNLEFTDASMEHADDVPN
jgi:hypothetical protein